MSTLAVTMTKIGSTMQAVDVTQYLADEDSITLTEELERRAFERKHGDIHLKLSNLRGYFTTLFADTLGTTRWEVVVIVDGTARWRGEVSNKSITFLLDSQWVELDAFSKTKMFWEHAKTIRRIFKFSDQPLWFSYETNGYIFLGSFFLAMNTLHDISKNRSIFYAFYSPTYTERKIRGVQPMPAPIGNEGRLVEIDPNMTFAELLEAFQKYYNAEFYIEPDGRWLVMRRRNEANTVTAKNIDILLLEDIEPKVTWLDDQKVDYIYAFSKVLRMPIPEFVITRQLGQNEYGLQAGSTQSYLMTGIVNGVENLISETLVIVLPQSGQGFALEADIRMPASQHSGIQRRYLYRNDSTRALGMRRVKALEGNTTQIVSDRMVRNEFANAPALGTIPNNVNAWIGYDEAANLWLAPILDLDNGKSKPAGIIHDVVPKVRFTFIGNPELIPEKPYDVFCFFGQESEVTSDAWKNMWIDWFRTKRKVTCKVKDMDYVLSNPIQCGRFPNDLTPGTSYSIKKFSSKLMKEETELELLSV